MRLVKSPILVGSIPLKVLKDNHRTVRLVNSPISVGSMPLKYCLYQQEGSQGYVCPNKTTTDWVFMHWRAGKRLNDWVATGAGDIGADVTVAIVGLCVTGSQCVCESLVPHWVFVSLVPQWVLRFLFCLGRSLCHWCPSGS